MLSLKNRVQRLVITPQWERGPALQEFHWLFLFKESWYLSHTEAHQDSVPEVKLIFPNAKEALSQPT